MNKTRAERAAALETWADRVDADDLVPADTEALRAIAELAEQWRRLHVGDLSANWERA